jgi:hypothetical protein
VLYAISMANSLSDFSIESENIVILSFFDGSCRRVKHSDLPKHLNNEDLVKVENAIRMRKNFIEKVLPPGAAIILIAATAILSVYDFQRFAQIIDQETNSAVTEVTNNKPDKTLLLINRETSYGTATIKLHQNKSAPQPVLQPATAPIVTPPQSPPALKQAEKPKKPVINNSKPQTTSILQRTINKVKSKQ